MSIRKLLTVALIAGALAPMPSRAATTLNVEVRNGQYLASALAAVAGDTITWRVTAGKHEIKAYAGATWDSASPQNAQPDPNTGVCPSYPCGGDPTGMTPYKTFSVAYTGGTVLYRCTLTYIDQEGHTKSYSNIDPNTGVCSGMCGKVTDTPPANLPAKPTIAGAPRTNSTVVDFSGAATNSNTVILRQYTGSSVKELVSIPVSGTGTWAWPWDFGGNGTYTLDVIGVHTDGYRSDPSALVNVTVTAGDLNPPTIRLDKPVEGPLKPLVPNAQTGRLDIDGRAFDDVAIATVDVSVHEDQPAGVLGSDVTIKPVVTFQTGVRDSAFHAQLVVPEPGVYTVTVMATDSSLKRSVAVSRQVIMLL